MYCARACSCIRLARAHEVLRRGSEREEARGGRREKAEETDREVHALQIQNRKKK